MNKKSCSVQGLCFMQCLGCVICTFCCCVFRTVICKGSFYLLCLLWPLAWMWQVFNYVYSGMLVKWDPILLPWEVTPWRTLWLEYMMWTGLVLVLCGRCLPFGTKASLTERFRPKNLQVSKIGSQCMGWNAFCIWLCVFSNGWGKEMGQASSFVHREVCP